MARHPLTVEYGLTASEILDAIADRFRLRAALEGAISEVHMERHVADLVGKEIARYEAHDLDSRPDFSIWLPGHETPILAECKNVRASKDAGKGDYRLKGEVVAHKVETQKTRTSPGDPTSRYYDVGQFDILGVCLGKKTGDWTNFHFVRTSDLELHSKHAGKLAVFQRVPLADADNKAPWYDDLGQLLRERFSPRDS